MTPVEALVKSPTEETCPLVPLNAIVPLFDAQEVELTVLESAESVMVAPALLASPSEENEELLPLRLTAPELMKWPVAVMVSLTPVRLIMPALVLKIAPVTLIALP